MNTDEVIADVNRIVDVIRIVEREKSAFDAMSSEYKDKITIRYEDMFCDDGTFSRDTVDEIANLLNIDGLFDMRPKLRKLMPSDWRRVFSNWGAIRQSVSDAGYEHMLTLS